MSKEDVLMCTVCGVSTDIEHIFTECHTYHDQDRENSMLTESLTAILNQDPPTLSQLESNSSSPPICTQ